MGSKGEGKAEYIVMAMPKTACLEAKWRPTHHSYDLGQVKKFVDGLRSRGVKAKIMIRTVTEWCDITGPYGANEGAAAENKKEESK